MRGNEFITRIAPMLGIDVAELVTIDRYLATAGMRAKAQGRAVPDITLKEGLRFPLALMASRTPAQAITDLHDVERFKMMARGISVENGKPQALKQLIGLRLSELEELPLIDVLARMAVHLAKGGDAGVWLKVDLGGPVTIQVEDEAFTGEIIFTGSMDSTHSHVDLRREATISRWTLAFIGANCVAD